MKYRNTAGRQQDPIHSILREDDGGKTGWRSGSGSGPRINIQDAFLNHCRREHIRVDITMVNGLICTGTIAGFDPTVIALEKNGRQNLVFKSAVVQINPVEDVNYIFNEAYHNTHHLRTNTEYSNDFS